MAMFLMTEKLLEEELKKKPENLDDQQVFYYSMIEKELYLMKRLNIEKCDMRGEEKAIADRLEHSVVTIMPPEELEEMRNSVKFRYEIMDVINRY